MTTFVDIALNSHRHPDVAEKEVNKTCIALRAAISVDQTFLSAAISFLRALLHKFCECLLTWNQL